MNGERGLANVTEQIDITRRAYRIFDKTDNLVHYVFEGEHVWNGKMSYSFFDEHLK